MTRHLVLHSLYLGFVLVGLSLLAWRNKARLESASAAALGSRPMPSRERILASTLFSQLVLLGMSWEVAELSGIHLFVRPALGARELAAALVVLGAHFGLRRIALALHSPEELRKSLVAAWIPRPPR